MDGSAAYSAGQTVKTVGELIGESSTDRISQSTDRSKRGGEPHDHSTIEWLGYSSLITAEHSWNSCTYRICTGVARGQPAKDQMRVKSAVFMAYDEQ